MGDVMSTHVFRKVNGRNAYEYVTTLRERVPERPWLPGWQRVAWWAVAAFIALAMCGTFGRGW
jgi:hypothetical protein